MFETVMQTTAKENTHLCYKNLWQIPCMTTSPGLSLYKSLSSFPLFATQT